MLSTVNQARSHMALGFTETSLHRNVVTPVNGYLALFRAYGLFAKTFTTGGTHILVPLPTGDPIRIWMFGGSDITAANRIPGISAASALFDELPRMRQDVVETAWGRIDAEIAPVWATANPEGVRHWSEDKYREWNAIVVKYVQDDNPGLSKVAADRIASGLTGFMYKRMVLGIPADAAGLVYPHWEQVEVLSVPPMHWSIGLDWASSGTFAAILFGEYPDRTVAMYERYHNGMVDGVLTEEEQATATDVWARRHIGSAEIPIVGDPNTPKGFQKTMRNRGYKWHDGDNDVLEGIRKTSTALQLGEYVVSDQCPQLGRELDGYIWDETAARAGEDKPVKERDHGCDAFRYRVYTDLFTGGTMPIVF